MVVILAWIPLVRNLTPPKHTIDSSPTPAEGQSDSASNGAVIKVTAGAIWTIKKPVPQLHPVKGPAGSVGFDSGAIPTAATISSSLRRAQTLIPPVSDGAPSEAPPEPLHETNMNRNARLAAIARLKVVLPCRISTAGPMGGIDAARPRDYPVDFRQARNDVTGVLRFGGFSLGSGFVIYSG